jgi:hypothetical protein
MNKRPIQAILSARSSGARPQVTVLYLHGKHPVEPAAVVFGEPGMRRLY